VVGRLKRIEALASDLAREVGRSHGQTATARAMAETIRQDIAVVLETLGRQKPSREAPPEPFAARTRVANQATCLRLR
jgi:hypothetical protein